jgi:hypothetical protein
MNGNVIVDVQCYQRISEDWHRSRSSHGSFGPRPISRPPQYTKLGYGYMRVSVVIVSGVSGGPCGGEICSNRTNVFLQTPCLGDGPDSLGRRTGANFLHMVGMGW